jgi:septum formation protein
MPHLILASTSPSRKTLLERLQIPFMTVAPDIDETALPHESPAQLVKRLAIGKAKVHAHRFPNTLIIGCDQVALLGKHIVSKPETHEAAVRQLKKSSDKKIQFFNGICLLNTATGNLQIAVERFTVFYRKLTTAMIENYLQKEKPYHCAGSIKAEGLGIALFSRVAGSDFTTITGLPLIRLVTMLQNEGVKII